MAETAANPAKFRRLLVGLPPALDYALRKRAAEEDRSLSWLIRKALREFLKTPNV